MEAQDNSYPGLATVETVFSFVTLVIALAYVLPFIICFIKFCDKPFLKMRSPYLVLISSFAIFIELVLIALPRVIYPAPTPFNTAKHEIMCTVRRFEVDVLNMLIALPYLIRAARVYFLKQKIEGLMQTKFKILHNSLIQQKVLAFILLTISVFLLAYAIIDIITSKYTSIWSPADLYRSCLLTDQGFHNFVASGLLFTILFLFYEGLLIFFIVRIRGIKEKVNLFFELAFFAGAWFLFNFLTGLQFTLSSMPFGASQGHFSLAAILLGIFTVSVTLQITRRKKYIMIEDCSGLLREFPESLHFWVCNYFFHQYLVAECPRYTALRPLLADIMRYEYGADDMLPTYSLQLQRSRAIDIYLKYLSPEGAHYFDFSRYGDLKEDLERRFDDLDSNLDEFLFEFLNTQIVELLSPVYTEFCETLYFKRMEVQSRRDEIFANVLQY